MANLEQLKKRLDELQHLLAKNEPGLDWEKLGRLEKEKETIKNVLQTNNEIEKLKRRINENEKLQKTEKDQEIIRLAKEENDNLSSRLIQLSQQLNNLIHKIEKDKQETAVPSSLIMEIRAGTGGDEAALFAADLFHMYSKYALTKNWSVKILDSHPTELGGFKEIIFEIKGKEAFSKLKYEGGVHRVQRIPETEKSGRIHTSTATVAVLPKPKPTEIKINPNEIKVEFYHSSGPGGQNVNKRMTAVRITHLPTGMVVTSQNERNQLRNKENALAILSARLLERKRAEGREKIEGRRKSQVGWAKRAEKIRTYNFPQNRVTDHRIKKTWHNLEAIMSGDLDEVIEALEKYYNQG